LAAARSYGGFPRPRNAHLDLAATAPWLWWAPQNWCAELEIAHDENAVLDCISGRVHRNTLCLRGGERRAIANRCMPVAERWDPDHYLALRKAWN